jgi:hypothetical protein
LVGRTESGKTDQWTDVMQGKIRGSATRTTMVLIIRVMGTTGNSATLVFSYGDSI